MSGSHRLRGKIANRHAKEIEHKPALRIGNSAKLFSAASRGLTISNEYTSIDLYSFTIYKNVFTLNYSNKSSWETCLSKVLVAIIIIDYVLYWACIIYMSDLFHLIITNSVLSLLP